MNLLMSPSSLTILQFLAFTKILGNMAKMILEEGGGRRGGGGGLEVNRRGKEKAIKKRRESLSILTIKVNTDRKG